MSETTQETPRKQIHCRIEDRRTPHFPEIIYCAPWEDVERLRAELTAAHAARERAEADADLARKAYAAACAYIDLVPCDPDVTPRVWAAYQLLQSARAEYAALNRGAEHE